MTTRQHTDKTSAADKSIGFDFQYYYFLWRLLNLKTGESIGLEVMDDVHEELAGDRQILIQLKHSVQTKADGTSINLTTLDADLWKSLSNWATVISDDQAGRGTEAKQLEFIEKTDFVLASNKSENESNNFIKALAEYQNQSKTFDQLKLEIVSIKSGSSDNNIKTLIDNVLSLTDKVCGAYFKNLRFDLGLDNIIDKCKTAIKEKHIDESKIDEVFSGLDSKLRAENYITTKNKGKILLSFDDVHKNFRACFDRARNGKLSIKRFSGSLPAKLADQNFIHQLVDINDIQANDSEAMAKFTRHLLQLQNNIDEWYRNGDITLDEKESFKSEAKERWENAYRSAYRGSHTEEEINKKALEILDAMRREILTIASQDLPTDMSNGQFYNLSNGPEIGWHKDWEKKYKK